MTGTVAADPSRQEQYLRQAVDALAGGIGERNVYCYPKLCQAAAFIEQSFRDAGYQPTRHEYQARDKSFANIEAEIRGQDSPQDIVIVGAHYDTRAAHPEPTITDLELRRCWPLPDHWSTSEAPVPCASLHSPTRSARFYARPRMGSRIYARRCRERAENIRAMLSLETIGYCSQEAGSQWLSRFGMLYPSRGDYIVFVANPFSKELLKNATQSFERETDITWQTATLPSFSPGAKSSDHWSFWKEGYPALMVTDTAPFRYPHYHKPSDTPDKLRYGFLNGVVEGLKASVWDLAN